MMSTSTAAIYAFSAITIGVTYVIVWVFVVWLLFFAVGWPLSYFFKSIKRVLSAHD